MVSSARRGAGRTTPRATAATVLLLALPFVAMALLVAVDAAGGAEVLLTPLLSVGPAYAALTGGIPYTLGAGACAVCLGMADAVYEGLPGNQVAIILGTVSGVTIASLLASASRQRRERVLAEVRAVAEVAQEVLLRPIPEHACAVQVAVRYLSASARAEIGGDLYEVVPVADGLRVLVGDVQGKGLPAVKTASATLSAFREIAYDASSLGAIVERLESSLGRQLEDEEFVTAVLAEFSRDGARLDLLNCGHPPPLLLPSTGRPRLLETPETGLPLGLAGLGQDRRTVLTLGLGPGDRVLFYTDGVSEARDPAGASYSLAHSAHLLSGSDPQDCLRRLHADVVAHVGHPLEDDAALLLAGRLPEPATRPTHGRYAQVSTVTDIPSTDEGRPSA